MPTVAQAERVVRTTDNAVEGFPDIQDFYGSLNCRDSSKRAVKQQRRL